MIVSFTEPLEVVFMMLIISVMRQNVTILLPVIMHWSSQAMEIYRYLGCKTNVIYCEKKAPDPSLPLAVLCKKTATP